jgi:hypothetical protein
MALPHPDSPELKRFSFFVSRRLEDNRERFRLHMGYFSSLAEAEEWLAVVRDIYPGAWAGEAPGKKLRERAALAAAQSAAASAPVSARVAPQAVRQPAPPAQARPAVSARPVVQAPQARPVAAPVPARPVAPPQAGAPNSRVTQASAPRPIPARLAAALSTPARAPVARSQAPLVVPTLHAAAPRTNAPAATAPRLAPRAPAPAPQRAVAPPQARAPLAARPQTPAPTARAPQAPAQRVAPRVPPPQARVSAPVPQKSLSSHSNVREVMASLDEETGATRMMQAPVIPRVESHGIDPSSLSDTQVLKILEHRRTESTEGASDEANIGISLLKPDDTGTRRALKEAVRENAPVAFAVQLQWSVQPVELDKVAPLAIFSAYTLYTVEGSREGRKWYGLRLGFFSDAISAKQVAHYVRSEFTSVAVVPVSPQERSRATDDQGKASASLSRKTHEQAPVEEFKLFDDAAVSAPVIPQPVRPAAAAKPAAKPLGKRGKSGGNRVRAREQRSEKTLEETLEILGASQLEIDSGRGEILNDTGVRHLKVEVQKETPFSRLLERLSERTRRS